MVSKNDAPEFSRPAELIETRCKVETEAAEAIAKIFPADQNVSVVVNHLFHELSRKNHQAIDVFLIVDAYKKLRSNSTKT